MSTTDDEFMRAGLDPTFRFTPIVKPPESVDRVLDKISAQADLIVRPCLTCDGKAKPTSNPGVVGCDHEPSCPNYVPEV